LDIGQGVKFDKLAATFSNPAIPDKSLLIDTLEAA
jgi:hypothetical protein